MPHRLRAPLPTLGLQQARTLRQSSTDIENELWYHLRGRRMQGVKFRRQHPIPPYTVDFYCDAAKLVIELDGSQHGVEEDRARTDFLWRRGLKVVRFSNFDVIEHRDAVLEAIWKLVAPFAPHPNLADGGGCAENESPLPCSPLPTGEGPGERGERSGATPGRNRSSRSAGSGQARAVSESACASAPHPNPSPDGRGA